MQDARRSETAQQLKIAVAETIATALSNPASMTAALKADITHHVSSLWLDHAAPACPASNPTEPESVPLYVSSSQAACMEPAAFGAKHRVSADPGRSTFQFSARPKASSKDSSASAGHQVPKQDAMQGHRDALHEDKAEGGTAGVDASGADSLCASPCGRSQAAARQGAAAWALPVMAALVDDKAGRGKLGRALAGPCLQGFLKQLHAMPTGESVYRFFLLLLHSSARSPRLAMLQLCKLHCRNC